MQEVFLSLGSNIGNKILSINDALEQINKNIGQVIKVSSFYETEPWGFNPDDWFVNIAVKIETDYNAESLLSKLQEIEKELGRKRKNKQKGYSSRIIDIDILFYGNFILEKDFIQIPHKHLHKRIFVLKPLNDIAPDFIHPIFNKAIKKMLSECEDKTQTKPLKNVN